jgi:hypothetical protein
VAKQTKLRKWEWIAHTQEKNFFAEEKHALSRNHQRKRGKGNREETKENDRGGSSNGRKDLDRGQSNS